MHGGSCGAVRCSSRWSPAHCNLNNSRPSLLCSAYTSGWSAAPPAPCAARQCTLRSCCEAAADAADCLLQPDRWPVFRCTTPGPANTALPPLAHLLRALRACPHVLYPCALPCCFHASTHAQQRLRFMPSSLSSCMRSAAVPINAPPLLYPPSSVRPSLRMPMPAHGNTASPARAPWPSCNVTCCSADCSGLGMERRYAGPQSTPCCPLWWLFAQAAQ